MSDRSWRAWKEQQDKYGKLRSSEDFRKKPGVAERIKRFLKKLFK